MNINELQKMVEWYKIPLSPLKPKTLGSQIKTSPVKSTFYGTLGSQIKTSPVKSTFYGTFSIYPVDNRKTFKCPTSDKVPLQNRAFQKQDCNNQRNSLNHTCRLPYSSVCCQVEKMQNTADICRLSVTNALPVYLERGCFSHSDNKLSNSGLNRMYQRFAMNR